MTDPQPFSRNGRLSPDALLVFKFGGTSVGTVDRFRRVIEIVRQATQSARVLVVNSALSQVTRQLSGALDRFVADTAHQSDVLEDVLETMRTRHRIQATDVLTTGSQMRYASIVEKRLARLREAFECVQREGGSPAFRDTILAAGEQLSVPMVALALEDAGFEAPIGDATKLLRTDAAFGEAAVDRDATETALCSWHERLPASTVPVIAGFIGGTVGGRTTTLGFEGSDYSAALFAALLNADVLVRYTDVDGLYTEDPQTHDDAERIDQISMEKAFALTESGRLGLHPKTLRPLVEAGIPLYIRSIIEPEAPGTHVVPSEQMTSTPPT